MSMNSRTKLGLITLLFLFGLVFVPQVFGRNWSQVYRFEYPEQQLARLVDQEVENTEGDVAVSVKDLTNSAISYSHNGSRQFRSASLYKLVLMAAVYQSEKDGLLKLNDSVSSTKNHLDNVLGESSSIYPNAPSSLEYSVEEALNRVATFSDNYAAVMLAERVRQVDTKSSEGDPLQRMAKQLGMTQTDFSGELPVTTADDITIFFDKAYHNEVVSPQASQSILDKLSKAELNDRIPAKLPQGLKIAHKTGEFAYLRHDAGIVYADNHPYIIVLMSENLNAEDVGIERLATISKTVYDFIIQ